GASIGADGTLNMNANTLSVNGSLNALLDNTGGSIGGSAKINFNLTGNLTTSGDANFLINNSNGGHIGTGGGITVHVAGDMNVGTSASFGISNVGGTIASNPVVDIRANNI